MGWYRYIPNSDAFDSVQLALDDDEPVVGLHYEHRSVAETWKPITVKGLDANPGLEGDFPTLNNYSKIPIFSERAWDILAPLISYCSEALRISHPSGKLFYLINVLEIIDCLDEERSDLSRNPTTGRVSRVSKYCFRTSLLQGKHVFKTPLKSGAELFVGESFREVVEENGLKGLIFEKISTQK